jgi:hypothetical protein
VPAKIRLVVPAQVVVLDPQIAVEQQALGDDEVVRLVAAGKRRRDLPGRNAEDDGCGEAGGER